MATTEIEVPFDRIKHESIQKGGVVGNKGLVGYLIYPTPPVGCMGPITNKSILKDMEEEAIGQRGLAANGTSTKAVWKSQEKTHRRAMAGYLSQ